jgi:hypothetical protein
MLHLAATLLVVLHLTMPFSYPLPIVAFLPHLVVRHQSVPASLQQLDSVANLG